MSLVDEITELRDDCLASLDASHDYYSHTKSAWRIIQQMVQQGRKFTIRNQETGNKVEETELSGLAQEYVTGYLASATFQHFVSLHERFVADFVRAWLREYPDSLSGKQLLFETVLAARTREEIISAVIDAKVVELFYGRPTKWFAYFSKTLGLSCADKEQIEQLAEIKASRDVLVHNKGIANALYVDKSGEKVRFKDGQALELPEQYHRESWQLIKELVNEMANAGINKLVK